MDSSLRQWRDDQKHLPEFMRDFHDCKDLFKAIDQYIVCEPGHLAGDVSWIEAHCYTIDVFLWFMAEHGYTLQKSRAKQSFSDLPRRIKFERDTRHAAFSRALTSMPGQKGEVDQ